MEFPGKMKETNCVMEVLSKKDIPKGLKNIPTDIIDNALEALEKSKSKKEKRVHEARKLCLQN